MDHSDQLRTALSDRYRIEGRIGAGGMATVYLAEDLKHRRRVALKVLRPELGAIVGPERFIAEINVTANLQHPHLLPLFDFSDSAGVRWPVLLAGGREILYTARAQTDSAELRLANLATGEVRTILRPAFQARYTESGHLVFARPDSALYAVPFDPGRRALAGAPVRVLDGVAVGPQSGTHFTLVRPR